MQGSWSSGFRDYIRHKTGIIYVYIPGVHVRFESSWPDMALRDFYWSASASREAKISPKFSTLSEIPPSGLQKGSLMSAASIHLGGCTFMQIAFKKNYSSAPASFHRVCDNASPLPEAATARRENARQQILGGRCGLNSCLNKTSDLALKNACHTYKWKLLPCIVQCWHHLNAIH